jgi:hypothetical protein
LTGTRGSTGRGKGTSPFGLLLSASAIANLADGIGKVARWRRRTVLTGGLLTAGVCTAALGITADPVVASVLYGAFGVPIVAVNVVSVTVRHHVVPEACLGRVRCAGSVPTS